MSPVSPVFHTEVEVTVILFESKSGCRKISRPKKEGSLVNRIDLQASYLSGTYYQKTVTRPPSCAKPRQPTIYFPKNVKLIIFLQKSLYAFGLKTWSGIPQSGFRGTVIVPLRISPGSSRFIFHIAVCNPLNSFYTHAFGCYTLQKQNDKKNW